MKTEKISSIRLLFVMGMLISSILTLYSQNTNKDGNFKNVSLLNPVFEKLFLLDRQKTGKVNIVHIGDSHIQADFFTNTIREDLQNKFGNGGYGFSFPYSLAKTNGTNCVKFTSNIEWNSRRNIYPVTDVSIGLSGIGLYTDDSDFSINMTTIPEYAFNVVKLLYPTTNTQFRTDLGGSNIREISQQEKEKLSTQTVRKSKLERQNKIHIVQSGETLYNLSLQYNLPIEDLKKNNGLNSNTINTGMKLIIPTTNKIELLVEQKKEKIDTIPIVKSTLSTSIKNAVKPYCVTYIFPELLNEVSIVPDENVSEYNLSGVVLENDQPGLIYHSIGVNGTKFSDYNKYPLFFEQLPHLQPDLLIISLGTNESFGKWSTPNYIAQMQLFIDRVKQKNPNIVILIMTPPPSQFKRKKPNTFVADYSEAIKNMKNCVVWDLFEKLGGTDAPNQTQLAPLMAKDKVHYTKDGYRMQGELFATDFLFAYANYIKNKKN